MSGGDVYITFGGETSQLEASLATAKASVNALSSELRDLAKQMQATGASADSELGQKTLEVAEKLSEAKAAVADFKSELRGAGSEAEGGFAQMAEAAATVKESFLKIAEIAGIAFSAEALKEWVESTAELGEHLESVAAELGATVPQVSELSAVAKLTGTDFDSLALSLERMQLKLASAGKDSAPVSQALKVLGINAKEFATIPIPQQLDRLAQAFSSFADGPTKTAAAMELLGRNGAQMIPYLDKGREGLEELRQVAAATGSVMSSEVAQALAETKDALVANGLAWEALSTRLFTMVSPAINAALGWMTRLIEATNVGALKGNFDEFTADVAKLALDIQTFCKAAMGPISDLMALGKQLADVLNTIIASENAVADLTKKYLYGGKGLLDQAMENSANFDRNNGPKGNPGTGGASLSDVSSSLALTQLTSNGSAAAASLEKVAKAGDIVVRTGQKPQVPQMQLGGGGPKNNEAEAELAALNEEIDAYKENAKQKEIILDGELKAHQITMSQWLTATTDALGDERQDVESTYASELAVAGLTSQKIAQIKREEAKALAQIDQQILQSQSKAAEQAAQEWKSFTSTVDGAFNSQISGLLKGTETFGTAFKNVIAELLTKFITFAADIALNWVLSMTGMKTAVATFNAALAPLMASGTISSAAAQKPGILAEISADTGAAYAGFAAFLAPLLGPGAPAAAAGLAAQVGSTATSMAAFDIGAYAVPHDQLALIHQNELVMPAGPASAFRSMLEGAGAGGGAGGGAAGPQFHFNGPIIGTQSWINQMMPQLARAMQAYTSLNRTSYPNG